MADHRIGLGAVLDALAVDRPAAVARETRWLDDALADIRASQLQLPETLWPDAAGADAHLIARNRRYPVRKSLVLRGEARHDCGANARSGHE